MTAPSKMRRRSGMRCVRYSSSPRLVPPRHCSMQKWARRTAGGHVDPASVFNDLLPDLAESKDDFAWACCPFHDDNNPSFSVNLVSGWYRCFSTSCGQTGTNIVSFVGALMGTSAAEARRYVEARYGR